MRRLILAGLFFLAGGTHAQTVAPIGALPAGAMPLPARAVGRMERLRDGRDMVYRHQWPGIYFETRFTGDAAYLGFDDKTNEYRLTVDGGAPIAIVKPGKTWLALGGLTAGTHSLRLEKVTESIDQMEVFDGFYLPPAARAQTPPPARKRAIEFIGDSGMTGYGVRSTTRTCTKPEVHDRTDTQQAWPVLTARHFDADYEVNAISGRGMVRNYEGAVPGFTMTDVYPYTFFDKTVAAKDSEWHPNVVMVGLGGNDFTALQPGEKWKSDKAVAVDYFAAYGRFVADLYRRYPRAVIVVMVLGADDAEGRQMVQVGRQSIESKAAAAGLKRLVFMTQATDFHVDRDACDYHGSLADHKAVAKAVIDWLESHPEVWR